jgi:MFS family permease
MPVLIDPKMFGRRYLRPSLLSTMASQTVAVGLLFAILLYLQTVLGYSALASGLALLPMAVSSFVASLLWPKLSRILSPRAISLIGMGLLASAAAVLYWSVSPRVSGNPFLLAAALLGLSLGLLTSQLSAVSQGAVLEDERGSVGGVHFTAHGLGTALGPAIVGTVVIAGLASAMTGLVQSAPGLRAETRQLANLKIERNLPFLSQSEAALAVSNLGIPKQDAAQVQAELQAALADHLGEPIDWLYATVHRWRYAMPDRSIDAPTDPCWWDAAQGLGVCGDFFAGLGVEGAWLSGRELAQAISR